MKLKRSSKSAALAAIAALALSGCNTSGCLQNQNSLPLAGFYSSATGLSIALDSVAIGGVGAPNDSLLNSYGAVSTIYLPFRSATDTTSFYFRYTSKSLAMAGIADTIRFRYESVPRFVSEDCGAMYYYRITAMSHTTELIDSVVILDSLVTPADIQRINIYFHTSEPNTPQE